MKLLFIAHDSTLTGASKSMLSLIVGLQTKHHSITVFLPEKGVLEKALINNKIPCKITGHRLNTSPIVSKSWSFLKRIRLSKFKLQRLIINRKLVKNYKKTLGDLKPDAIVTNTSTTYFGALLAEKIGVKHIWHLREFGELDHGFTHDFEKQFKFFLQNSSVNICISKSIEDYFKEKYDLKNTQVVYNGLFDISTINQEEVNLESHNQQPIFIFVGQLTKSKGIWKFIHAIASLSETKSCKAIILGDGPEFEDISEYLNKYDLREIFQLLGHVKNPEHYYKQADCFIMASDYEAFGRTTVEAIVFGCLVIANKGGATKELLTDKKEALFFDISLEELNKTISLFLSLKDQEVKQIKASALAKVKSQFTTDVMVKNFINVVENVLIYK